MYKALIFLALALAATAQPGDHRHHKEKNRSVVTVYSTVYQDLSECNCGAPAAATSTPCDEDTTTLAALSTSTPCDEGTTATSVAVSASSVQSSATTLPNSSVGTTLSSTVSASSTAPSACPSTAGASCTAEGGCCGIFACDPTTNTCKSTIDGGSGGGSGGSASSGGAASASSTAQAACPSTAGAPCTASGGCCGIFACDPSSNTCISTIDNK